MQWKDAVPKRFYNASERTPVVFTVGELKKELADLPDNLPLDFEGVALVVANVSETYGCDCHLSFEDGNDFLYDED